MRNFLHPLYILLRRQKKLHKTFIKGLSAEIQKELETLKELKKEMKNIKTKNSIIYRRSIASILHDFYNCCERIFKKIAIEVNGGFEENEKWHKALLFKMTVKIKGVRPAVITDKLAAELDEYLSFRHVFRNIYGFELKGERIDYLANKFDRVATRFEKEIKKFLNFLKKEQKKS